MIRVFSVIIVGSALIAQVIAAPSEIARSEDAVAPSEESVTSSEVYVHVP